MSRKSSLRSRSSSTSSTWVSLAVRVNPCRPTLRFGISGVGNGPKSIQMKLSSENTTALLFMIPLRGGINHSKTMGSVRGFVQHFVVPQPKVVLYDGKIIQLLFQLSLLCVSRVKHTPIVFTPKTSKTMVCLVQKNTQLHV